MAITRDQIITKHATLAGNGLARMMGDYVVLFVPGENGAPPVSVEVLDASRKHVFLQHAQEDEPLEENYIAGPWELLITS